MCIVENLKIRYTGFHKVFSVLLAVFYCMDTKFQYFSDIFYCVIFYVIVTMPSNPRKTPPVAIQQYLDKES